jgi:RNA polymerase sigma-70 factor (ECF subfamily)
VALAFVWRNQNQRGLQAFHGTPNGCWAALSGVSGLFKAERCGTKRPNAAAIDRVFRVLFAASPSLRYRAKLRHILKRQETLACSIMAILMSDLWSEHRSRLRGYIARRVRDTNAVDDILQEVFLKASKNLQSLKSPGSIAAWLYRIATNAIADHYRSLRPWEELPDDVAAPKSERDYVAELATCLQPLIAGMPEAYRGALMLSEIEGLPQREVAARLNISLSGAKSRVQRGREKLHQRLLDCCDIETRRGGITGYEPRDKNRKCNCD